MDRAQPARPGAAGAQPGDPAAACSAATSSAGRGRLGGYHRPPWSPTGPACPVAPSCTIARPRRRSWPRWSTSSSAQRRARGRGGALPALPAGAGGRTRRPAAGDLHGTSVRRRARAVGRGPQPIRRCGTLVPLEAGGRDVHRLAVEPARRDETVASVRRRAGDPWTCSAGSAWPRVLTDDTQRRVRCSPNGRTNSRILLVDLAIDRYGPLVTSSPTCARVGRSSLGASAARLPGGPNPRHRAAKPDHRAPDRPPRLDRPGRALWPSPTRTPSPRTEHAAARSTTLWTRAPRRRPPSHRRRC